MMNIADLARTLSTTVLSRNQLKVIRARLRKAGVTNLTGVDAGAYTIDPSNDNVTDARAINGTAMVTAVAEAM